MTRYYVYTPCDGNEDGLMDGYTLDDAKVLAIKTFNTLVELGEPDTRVYVMELGSGNHVWGLGEPV